MAKNFKDLQSKMDPKAHARAVAKAEAEGRAIVAGENSMSNSFMQRAIELAIANARECRGGPFGALVVKDGRIIGEGVNNVTAINDPTAHAEVVAIREACRALGSFQLDGCEIYTSCQPCPMCLGAIYWARPARVFYACTERDAADAGFDDSFIYRELEQPLAARRIPLLQLMREESLKAFEVWKNTPSRIEY